jgi:hypothetical protein
MSLFELVGYPPFVGDLGDAGIRLLTGDVELDPDNQGGMDSPHRLRSTVALISLTNFTPMTSIGP